MSEGLSHNVLSSAKLADGGIKTLFTSDGVKLIRDETVVAVGYRKGNLYYIDAEVFANPGGESIVDSAYNYQQVAGNDKFVWHLRFAHANYEYLRILSSKGLVRGMENYDHSQPTLFCEACALAKAKRAPFGQLPRVNLPRSPQPEKGVAFEDIVTGIRHLCLMDRISVDLVGPFDVQSIRGARYMCLAIEHYSSYVWGWPLARKSMASPKIKCLLEMLHNKIGAYPKQLRMDNGGEFTSSDFQTYLQDKGIQPDSGPRETPQYNMKQERTQLHIETLANASLISSPLSANCWDYAWLYAIYARNRQPGPKEAAYKTAYERLCGEKPNVSRLRPFGCLGYCTVPTSLRKKMKPKALKAWLLGYHEERKAYLMLTTDTRKLVTSRDVAFAEGPYVHHCLGKIANEVADMEDGANLSGDGDQGLVDARADHEWMADVTGVGEPLGSGGELIFDEADLADDTPNTGPAVTSLPPADGTQPSRDTAHTTADEALLPDRGALTSGADTTAGPAIPTPDLPAYTDNSSAQPIAHRTRSRSRSASLLSAGGGPPTTPPPDEGPFLAAAEAGPPLRQALQDDGWKRAMKDEWDSFIEQGVYTLVPRAAARGSQILRAVWVLTEKTTATGETILKARCCVDGSRAWEQGESYAPVIDKDSLRIILGLAWGRGMHVENFDVKTAYLYGTLDQPRYMEIPAGVLPKTDRSKYVLKLLKSVYGLPEAGRVWNDTFSDYVITKMGFKRMVSSPAAYAHTSSEGSSYIAVHVDDGAIASPNEHVTQSLLTALKNRFNLKVMGIAPRFLGLQQELLRSGDLLWHQQEKVTALLETFDDQTLRPATIPLSTTSMDKINQASGPVLEPDLAQRYHSAVGSALYLVQNCRVDIALAAGILARFVQEPRVEHWNALLLLLGYLKQTSKAGILFKRGAQSPNKRVDITVYTDADFATVDEDSKSTSGVLIYVGGVLVAFASKKQTTVARSTTEAEGLALKYALTLLEFIAQVLGELGMKHNTPVVLEDNTAVIALMHGPRAYKARTKHLIVAFNFCRQMVRSGIVVLRHVPSTDQLADLLTKPLTRVCFERLRSLLGMGGI